MENRGLGTKKKEKIKGEIDITRKTEQKGGLVTKEEF
jgi:hypothetical protein